MQSCFALLGDSQKDKYKSLSICFLEKRAIQKSPFSSLFLASYLVQLEVSS